MEEICRNALTEVYTILKFMPMNYIKKLNPKFIKFIENNKNEEYKYKVDNTKKIEEQHMLIETKAILSIMYRDYWCTDKQRQEILQKEQSERKQYQSEMQEKYNPNNIFKNNKNEGEGRISKEKLNVELIEYKENIFRKIINKIKEILHIS